MKIAWITDPHLDCVTEHVIKAFARHTNNIGADAVVITGDIGDGPAGLANLAKFGAIFHGHIYFVIGNHDLYDSNMTHTLKVVRQLCQDYPNLVFLDDSDVIELGSEVALVGNSGFYDCRAGSANSRFQMTMDWKRNKDLAQAGGLQDIMAKCRQIAESMAKPAKRSLLNAANAYKTVYFATHVPPFVGASWHRGKPSDTEALPWFTNLTFGQLLSDVAYEYTDVQFTVLCGHTHSCGEYQHFDNLKVLTGAAEYCYPCIWKLIEV